jgi:hypothetical protein
LDVPNFGNFSVISLINWKLAARALVTFSAFISFLLAFLRAFLSGVESELLFSSEDEGLDLGVLEEALPFFSFSEALAGAGLVAAALVGEGVGSKGVGISFLSTVAGATVGGDRLGDAGNFPLGLPSLLGELGAIPSSLPSAALSLGELGVVST